MKMKMKKKKTKMGYFKVRSFASGTRSLALKGQFIACCSMAGLFITTYTEFFQQFSANFGFSLLYKCIGKTKQPVLSLQKEYYRTL